MNKTRKLLLGLLVAAVLLAAAALGIWGWAHQFQRGSTSTVAAAQETPTRVNLVPIVVQPILR
jgi:ABC-type transporter Mla subunit MlaD